MAQSSYENMSDDNVEMLHPKDDIALNVIDTKDFFPHNPFSESFDASFWEAVSGVFNDGNSGKSWAVALSEVRTDILTKRYTEQGSDVFVGLMTDVYDRFYAEAVKKGQLELMPSFIQQISELVNIILNKDIKEAQASGENSKYSKLLKYRNTKKTALHFVSERNLVQVAKHIISLYPGQCYIESSGDRLPKQIPLEMSLTKKMDETSSVLVKSMLNDRVRQLFDFDEALGKAKFSFSQMTGNINMKQTVLAVLDCLINPDYPYVPVQPNEDKNVAWSKIPDLPMRYHVCYRLLDGDEEGRPAKVKELTTGNFVENVDFNHTSPSGLYMIANSPFNNDIISHPAVRLLIQHKWQSFGQKRIVGYLFFYLFYLLCMSVGFFVGGGGNDRSAYQETLPSYVRAIAEFLTLVISLIYLVSEIDQMVKEGKRYWKDFYNCLDLLGLILIILMLPIKWSTNNSISGDPSKIEWSIASLAYLINFSRMLKYFCAFKPVSVYLKTFAKLVYYDFWKFFLLCAVVMWATLGSIYLALKSTSDGLSRSGFFSWKVFLQEIRALSAGTEFADNYVEVFSVGVIILITLNMFGVMLILVNILIAQLSYRFKTALEFARIQYDVDKTKIVARLENSRFRRWNTRISNYVDGADINETALVNELREDWDTIMFTGKECNNQRESVRAMMEKLIKKHQ